MDYKPFFGHSVGAFDALINTGLARLFSTASEVAKVSNEQELQRR
jgi:hypothetical protein